MFRARRGDDDLMMDTERRAHGVFVELDRGAGSASALHSWWVVAATSERALFPFVDHMPMPAPRLQPPGSLVSRSGSRPHASERAAHRPDHAEAMPDRLVRVVSPFRARALPPKYMRRALHQPAQKILLARRAGARPSGSWVCVFVGPWAWTAGVRGGVHLQLDGLTSASASSPCVGVGHATLVTIYAR